MNEISKNFPSFNWTEQAIFHASSVIFSQTHLSPLPFKAVVVCSLINSFGLNAFEKKETSLTQKTALYATGLFAGATFLLAISNPLAHAAIHLNPIAIAKMTLFHGAVKAVICAIEKFYCKTDNSLKSDEKSQQDKIKTSHPNPETSNSNFYPICKKVCALFFSLLLIGGGASLFMNNTRSNNDSSSSGTAIDPITQQSYVPTVWWVNDDTQSMLSGIQNSPDTSTAVHYPVTEESQSGRPCNAEEKAAREASDYCWIYESQMPASKGNKFFESIASYILNLEIQALK